MTASEETRVGIKAAFPVKKRELNGLNRVAAFLNDNRAERIPISGYVEFVKHTETIEGDEMTVALVVVEAMVDAQGRSIKGYAEDVRRMIEDVRKSQGKPSVAETLFDAGTKKDLDEQLEGQIEGIDRKAAGERDEDGPGRAGGADLLDAERTNREQVAEKSADELAAERAEGVPAAEQTVTDAPAKTDGQQAFEKDVVAGMTSGTKPAGRKARGATVRPPTADPFTPGDAA